jgi:hypothetical protein
MADTMSDIPGRVEDITEAATEKVEEMGAIEAKIEGSILPTETRVQENTPEEINRRIRRDLKARVLYFAQRPEEIDRRLQELDHEWDIERLLQANAGAVSLMGLTFGVLRRRWYILPAAVAAFLIQHAVQGWCPPVSLFRRIGIRTTREINHERYALKALRGDFDNVSLGEDLDPQERARRAMDAADMGV